LLPPSRSWHLGASASAGGRSRTRRFARTRCRRTAPARQSCARRPAASSLRAARSLVCWCLCCGAGGSATGSKPG